MSEISAQTFECFVCKKNGFPDEQIYLKGHTPEGYPIRIELDKVTPHRHKGVGTKWKEAQQQQQQQQIPAAAAAVTPPAVVQQQQQQPQSRVNERSYETTLKSILQGYNEIMDRLDQIIIKLNEMNDYDPTNDDGDSSRENPERDP